MQLAIDAADFTPGEADLLRRSMAAWRRKGDLKRHRTSWSQASSGTATPKRSRSITCQADRGLRRVRFPEAMRPSFANWSMSAPGSSATIRRLTFLCALLNSQPMGFYSPSQLVAGCRPQRRARAAGGRRRAAGTARWSCATGSRGGRARRRRTCGSAWGGSRACARRPPRAVEAARAAPSPAWRGHGPARRAGPPRHRHAGRRRLLASLAGHRRQARWQARAATLQSAHRDLLYEAPPAVGAGAAGAALGEEVAADYTSLGLSLKAHPLALPRRRQAMRFATARELADCPDGRRVRACGIVTVRQRPAAASGTIFTSIEDETGAVNVILWPDLIERERKTVLGARLLGVSGIQQQGRGPPPGGRTAGGPERAARAAGGQQPRFPLSAGLIDCKRLSAAARLTPAWTSPPIRTVTPMWASRVNTLCNPAVLADNAQASAYNMEPDMKKALATLTTLSLGLFAAALSRRHPPRPQRRPHPQRRGAAAAPATPAAATRPPRRRQSLPTRHTPATPSTPSTPSR